MNTGDIPTLKDLVLIGGGHSHVAVIKSFGMNPVPGVRLTIIARDVHTPYSGMLPGFIAGHYNFDEVHVDLRPLSQFAGARLYHSEAVNIDLEGKRVICNNRPPVPYDVLSINIGSTPRIGEVPGAEQYTTPVKPINNFVNRWEKLSKRIMEKPGKHRIGVVGAGAAGVEVLLAMQYRLEQMLDQRARTDEKLEFHLVCRSDEIMPTFPSSVAAKFDRVLVERNISVVRSTAASAVEYGFLKLEDGSSLKLDEILFVTEAGAAGWLGQTGLQLDQNGFIKVHDSLQSVSHPEVFAAGDIASVLNYPRAKAGVFAVRQGKPLSRNLRSVLRTKKPTRFKPQRSILALVSTGDRYAVASKFGMSVEGKLVWRWKDWIDRRWMAKYTDLPDMTEEKVALVDSALGDRDTLKEISAIAMRCGGCGAKVGANVLTRALSELKPPERDDILVGLHDPDDAAVVEVPAGKVAVHSVDYFRSFIDDPYIFGQVSANHSLSDLFAMGATPQSALAIATIPYGIENKVEETIRQLMAGAMEVLNDAGAALVGGHTSEGAELALGFSVNGFASRNQVLRKGGMRPGDRLILTKALGTGTLFAADMKLKAKGRWINGALESMIKSNRLAGRTVYQYHATACTDITGFGLLGHLVEMIRPSKVDVQINLSSLPILEGALDTVKMGILSTLQPANVRLRRAIRNMEEVTSSEFYPLLFDPQTSGGLLASIPDQYAENCLKALHDEGYEKAAIIGMVEPEGNQLEPITFVH